MLAGLPTRGMASSETISYAHVDGGSEWRTERGGAMINEVLIAVSFLVWIPFGYMIWRWMRIGERK